MDRQPEADLTGKVAIITGASRGIGMQTAIMLADRGAKVVVPARTITPGYIQPGTVGETVAQVEARGGEELGVAADMAKEEDLKALVDATLDHFGGVDILVNNAGVTMIDSFSAPLLDIPMEDWLYQFAVNGHAPSPSSVMSFPSWKSEGEGAS
jgi:NAD(P)-dependent dehydrogenase (short-subunit alcohol dehydrogenase family)